MKTIRQHHVRHRCVGVLLSTALPFASPAFPQRIIYGGQRDKAAQDAQEAAKQLASAALFETMLRNVTAQANTAITVQPGQDAEQGRSRWGATLADVFTSTCRPVSAGQTGHS